MINTTTDILNIEQTITRPTVVTILNDLKFIFRINPNILTEIENSIEQTSNLESLLTKPISFIYGDNQNSKLEVSYREDTEVERIRTISIDDTTYRPILIDTEIDLLVRPIYYFTTLHIELKYKTKSKNEITKFINNFKLQAVKNNDTLYHSIVHRVHIPKVVAEFIKTVYEIKESKLPKYPTIEEYLNSVSATLLYGSSQNSQIVLVAVDRQVNIIGQYETDMLELKPEYEKDTGYYSVSIEYKVSYNKPLQLYIKYPELIYNTLLPSKYLVERDYILERVKVPDGNDTTFTNNSSIFTKAIAKGVEYVTKLKPTSSYLKIPSFDTITLEGNKPQMVKVFSVLVIPESDGYLCNLNDLDGFTLNSSVYNCLKRGEYKYLLEPYKSVFHLELYRGGVLLDSSKYLRVDEELDVWATQKFDVRYPYRIVLNIVLDLDYIGKEVLDRGNDCAILGTLFKVLGIDTEYLIEYSGEEYNRGKNTIEVSAILERWEE